MALSKFSLTREPPIDIMRHYQPQPHPHHSRPADLSRADLAVSRSSFLTGPSTSPSCVALLGDGPSPTNLAMGEGRGRGVAGVIYLPGWGRGRSPTGRRGRGQVTHGLTLPSPPTWPGGGEGARDRWLLKWLSPSHRPPPPPWTNTSENIIISNKVRRMIMCR